MLYYMDDSESELELLGTVDLIVGCYDYDMVGIWVHKETGVFYGAWTSGCSCSSPFDDIQTVDDLTELGTNPHDARRYILSAESRYESPNNLISKVMNWKKGA